MPCAPHEMPCAPRPTPCPTPEQGSACKARRQGAKCRGQQGVRSQGVRSQGARREVHRAHTAPPWYGRKGKACDGGLSCVMQGISCVILMCHTSHKKTFRLHSDERHLTECVWTSPHTAHSVMSQDTTSRTLGISRHYRPHT